MRDIIDRIEASRGGGSHFQDGEAIGDFRRDAINEIRRLREIVGALRDILCSGGDERALHAALWREAERLLLGAPSTGADTRSDSASRSA